MRVGNGAFSQVQNDVYGALVDSLYIHTKADRSVPPQIWPIVADQVETAAAIWEQPDQGIWEARGEPKHYVSSKLMCWVALDRGARLANAGAARTSGPTPGARAPPRSTRTSSSAASRTVASCASTTTPTRSTPRHCSLPLVRFLPPDHDVVRATVARDRRRPHRPRPGAPLPGRGDRRRPRRARRAPSRSAPSGSPRRSRRSASPSRRGRCARQLLAFAGPLGLYAEEIEPRSGAHLGQLPAGVHAPGADQRGRPCDRRRAARGRSRGVGEDRGVQRDPQRSLRPARSDVPAEAAPVAARARRRRSRKSPARRSSELAGRAPASVRRRCPDRGPCARPASEATPAGGRSCGRGRAARAAGRRDPWPGIPRSTSRSRSPTRARTARSRTRVDAAEPEHAAHRRLALGGELLSGDDQQPAGAERPQVRLGLHRISAAGDVGGVGIGERLASGLDS